MSSDFPKHERIARATKHSRSILETEGNKVKNRISAECALLNRMISGLVGYIAWSFK